jgi:hypothetical protein
MKFSRLGLFVSSIAIVSVVFGYACTAGMYQTPIEGNALMENEQVVLKGFANAVSLSAVRAKADRLESGHMRVRIQLYKESLGADFVEIMTVFLGSDGFQLEQTNWEPFNLQEGIVTQYETSSLSTEVADFRTVIRVPPN